MIVRVLHILLPAALSLYFLYRALKKPVFLLGIPFLQVMGMSVFFDELKPFWMPGRFKPLGGTILIWLIVAWAWSVFRAKKRESSGDTPAITGGRAFLPEEWILVALAALTLGKLVWAGVGSAETGTILRQAEPWLFLLLGYWFIRGTVRRSSSQDLRVFLVSIAAVTGIGAVLYIVHQGLGVHIYDFAAHLTVVFHGQVLTRTFWFYPPFLVLGLCVVVARPSWNAATIGLVLLFIVTVIVSYTRSEFLVAAAVIFIVLALRLLKEGSPNAFLRRLSTIVAILALVSAVMLVVLPTQASYFLSRMASVTHASTIVGDQDLRARQVGLSTVASTVWNSGNAVAGSPFGGSEDAAEQVNTWTADTAWVGVIYWTGVLGVMLIGALFICYAVRALGLFLHSAEAGSEFLGLVFFAAVVAMFITSFFSWTFLNTFTYPMGFWLFAFIAGVVSKRPVRGNVPDRSAARLLEQTP